MKTFKLFPLILIAAFFVGCDPKPSDDDSENNADSTAELSAIEQRLEKYVEVQLSTDVSQLETNHKQMIPHLIEAAKIMDKLFWEVSGGSSYRSSVEDADEATKKFFQINYGPWDRLANNEPFVDGVGEKPKGAAFYPTDMSKEEFEASSLADKASLYTLIRRDSARKLYSIPYHQAFEAEVEEAADHLMKAAELAKDPAFKNYLELRAKALLTDEYYESDLAWMDMVDNKMDIIIGPIETYEDQLFGYKAAHESYILVKDMEWSERLAKYASMLPELQKNLPVEEKYKKEKPGTDSQLAAFDVIYYAGDCNSGSKTIAVNLPNDEKVQLEKGTRRSQLKNAMRAKFDKILLPISEVLIDPSQREYITFDAFFANTMFHEVAHGLGIKNTINGKGTVRESLKEHASALEEGKADILGLYMITQLHAKGEVDGSLEEYFTTFMASVFRSVRFGASSAHGKANMIRFNYFQEEGVISKTEEGKYLIDFDKMEEAMNSLSALILELQGNGDYEGVADLVNEKAVIGKDLQADLDFLSEEGIPVDVVFKQGVEVLGL
jgi:hypothetical protein